MTVLNTKPNIPDPDGFYAELLAAHEGLSDDESTAFNARLVMLLANHIGDRTVLSEAISAAEMQDVAQAGPATQGEIQ